LGFAKRNIAEEEVSFGFQARVSESDSEEVNINFEMSRAERTEEENIVRESTNTDAVHPGIIIEVCIFNDRQLNSRVNRWKRKHSNA
jgi:hypothetical protein